MMINYEVMRISEETGINLLISNVVLQHTFHKNLVLYLVLHYTPKAAKKGMFSFMKYLSLLQDETKWKV